MRCPNCDSKRTISFLYGLISPRRVHYCKKCKKLFYIKVEEIEPFICCKCSKPIIMDMGKYVVLANNKIKHKRCPRVL